MKRTPSAYVQGQGGLSGHLEEIERLTHYRSRTCPWRAYSDELVRDAMRIAAYIESGNLAAVLTSDMPAVVHDAVDCYWAALQSVIAEERKIRAEERARKDNQ